MDDPDGIIDRMEELLAETEAEFEAGTQTDRRHPIAEDHITTIQRQAQEVTPEK